MEEAQEFLREILKHGPVKSNLVVREACEAGIAERTLREAKRREAVRANREGFERGVWRWSLPPRTAPK